MKNTQTGKMALCGTLAALGVVFMLLGGLIPMSTYVCPALTCLLCFVVCFKCGSRMAWIWYAAVSILVLILGPDREAALVFLLLGYYPIIKPRIERSRLRSLWKLLFINLSILVLCVMLSAVMGLEWQELEFNVLSLLGTLLLLLLGNAVFFLLDRLLTQLTRKLSKGKNHG